ncbi:MAG: MFS transporter [Bacteriovoracaceae bacterium]|nr:MFS transporter [Bacteriovoracaceae bacterium]
MKKHEINSELRLFYFYHLFSNLDFARGIFAIYLVERGLQGAQIGAIQSILFISSMLFELPTGFVADKYSKKLSIILGVIVCAIVPILLFYSRSFYTFAAIFVFLGMGYSLTSGADTAMLYNRLETEGETWIGQFKKILGRSRSFRYTGLAFAVSMGGVLQSFGWEYVFFSVSGASIIAIIFISFFTELEDTHPSETENKKTPLKELFHFIKTKEGSSLYYLILGVSFIQAAATPLFIYSQIMFKEYELSNKVIGIIIASGLLISSFTYSQAWKIKVENFRNFLLLLSAIICAVMISFMFELKIAFVITLYLLAQCIPAILAVHFSDLLNSKIPTKIRATCLSLESLTGALVLSLANIVFGFLMDAWSVKVALGCLSVMPVFALISYVLYERSSRNVS